MDGSTPDGAHSFDLASIHRQAVIIRGWFRSEYWRRKGRATRRLNDRREHCISRFRRPYQDILALLRLSRRIASDCVHLGLHLGNGVSFFKLLLCSESESIFRFHVRWLFLAVDLPDHSSFVNWCSAEWAELHCLIIGVVGDKVVVAFLLELMTLMAGQLDDVLTFNHHSDANSAFADRFGAKSRIDRATKMPARPFNERLASRLVRGPFSNRLRSDEREPAGVLKFVPANGMIFKVVKFAELERHEVEAENAVFELLVVVDVSALVTAASQDGVEQEDGEASDHEDRVLQEVHDQVHVQS